MSIWSFLVKVSKPGSCTQSINHAEHTEVQTAMQTKELPPVPGEQVADMIFHVEVHRAKACNVCRHAQRGFSDVASRVLQGCSEWIALEGQNLPRRYLAQHELESVVTVVVIIIYYYCTQGTTAATQMKVRLHHKVSIKALGNLALPGPNPSNLARV